MKLRQHERLNRALLVVMDGVGERAEAFGNAVHSAWTPNLKWLKQKGVFTTITAHGKAVGLPSDQDIGNSEVGHNALGAGRIFDQGASLVQKAIDDGGLFSGPQWKSLVAHMTSSRTPSHDSRERVLHFLGLLSDGNVHSHENHLYAMLQKAADDRVKKIRIHVLFDGRDVSEKSAEIYVKRLNEKVLNLKSKGIDIEVASGGGRMTTTMDRYEADWSIVERGWRAHVEGEAKQFPNLEAAVTEFRKNPKLTDQNFPEFVIASQGKPIGTIEDGDAVVFFNFRGDRAIEISRAFTDPEFSKFAKRKNPKVLFFGMMQYDGDLKIPKNFLVPPPEISGTLGEHLVSLGLRQFACSETQKYGHVTYFWNGNRSGTLDQTLEEYLEIPSDCGISFDQRPWMKAEEICSATIERLLKKSFHFGRINFANGDMVGHTGNFDATVLAVQTVDLMLGRLIDACNQSNTRLIVTADHGNADEMFDAQITPGWEYRDGRPKPKTAHTVSPVPFCIYSPDGAQFKLKSGKFGLANVANSILEVMNLPTQHNYLPSIVQKQ